MQAQILFMKKIVFNRKIDIAKLLVFLALLAISAALVFTGGTGKAEFEFKELVLKSMFPCILLYGFHHVYYFLKSPQEISIDLSERIINTIDGQAIQLNPNDVLYIEEKSSNYHALFFGEFRTAAVYTSNDVHCLMNNAVPWIRYTKYK
ncbi:hypothetical protein [Rheinheimera sp. 4Y26]|uniref:hypothetical protein n=1 Tax=Rheinheimera sp. 4Y26 TaxID=2977811 RepID=UPI0021B0A927|nr:hypothetical protein [Rheinheimera sp. 4Y26]MCT6699992.1 hypothetical protein [Rheinheimera sp. 4Y26]